MALPSPASLTSQHSKRCHAHVEDTTPARFHTLREHTQLEPDNEGVNEVRELLPGLRQRDQSTTKAWKSGLPHDGTLVAELVEAKFAMVHSKSRLTQATEWNRLGNDLLEGGVHSGAPTLNSGQSLLHIAGALREDIKSQRDLPLPDDFQCLLEVVIGNDGQDRAEDLLLHNWSIHVWLLDDGRRYEALALPDALNSSVNDLSAASLDQLFHALSVSLVHEVPVIFLLPAVFSIAGLGEFGHFLYERLLLAPVHEHVVRCNTNLTTKHPLGKGNAAAGHIQLCRLVNKYRRLAAQLHGHWCQVLGGCSHDNTPDCPVSCVEDVVPAVVQKRCGLRHSTLDHPETVWIHVLVNEFGYQWRGLWVELAWLQNGQIASSYGGCQGSDKQLPRHVPRSNDQHDSLWLRADAQPVDPAFHPALSAPGVDVGQRVVNAWCCCDLRHPSHLGAAHVFSDGVADQFMVFLVHLQQLLQLGLTPGYVP
mmetsp:Transcript_31190/g.73251  ORF Transcript_31190/g.73251 Transcript_31190/m.73251 type:complete len:479 (+) Transcript_31190:182-1618(+)